MTTNIALNQPIQGTTPWTTYINTNFSILDQAFGATTVVNVVAGSNLITAPSSTSPTSTSQCMRILLQSNPSGAATIFLPQGVAGMWIITNSISTNQTVTIASNNGSNVAAGNTITVTRNYSTLVYCDGANVARADDATTSASVSSFSAGTTGLTPTTPSTGAVTLGGTLGFANGGTGLTDSGTIGYVLTSLGPGGGFSMQAPGGTVGVSTFDGGSTGLTPATASKGAVSLGGILKVGYGGTGVAATPTNGQILIGNSSTNTFSLNTLTAGTGIAIDNTTAGTIKISSTAAGGTVTSVALGVPATNSIFSVTGSPVTSSGTLQLNYNGTPLPISSGGTGISSFPTNGQILIGNTTTSSYSLTTLTSTNGISFTTGPGSIAVNLSGSYTGAFTASTGLTATTGNITATVGSVAAGTNIYVNATSGNVGVNVLASTGNVSYLGLTGTVSTWQNTVTTGTQASIYYDSTATPANGTYYFNPAGVNGVLKLSTAAFTSATTNYANSTSWTLISDQSQKTDVVNKSPQESVQRISSLRPVDFTWIKTGKRDAGFIAQDFEQVYPANVTEYFDDQIQQNIKAITINMNFYSDLVAVIQDLQKKVATLEAKLA